MAAVLPVCRVAREALPLLLKGGLAATVERGAAANLSFTFTVRPTRVGACVNCCLARWGCFESLLSVERYVSERVSACLKDWSMEVTYPFGMEGGGGGPSLRREKGERLRKWTGGPALASSSPFSSSP